MPSNCEGTEASEGSIIEWGIIMQVMLESDAGLGTYPKSFANLWEVAGCKPRPDTICRLSYFQIQDSASGVTQTVEFV